MTKPHTKTTKRYLTGPQVCTRYGGITAMALHRWVKNGVITKPIYINGKMYFDEDELDERDRERASQPYTLPKNIVAARRTKAKKAAAREKAEA